MVSVQKPEWQVVLHRTMARRRGTQTMLLFYVMRNKRRLPLMLAVMKDQQELVTQFELALNGVAAKIPASDNITALQRIFYGPWVRDDLTRSKYIRLDENDERQIKRMVYAEGAERLMAEAKIDTLQREISRLNSIVTIYEQRLSRYSMTDNADDMNERGDISADQLDLLAPSEAMFDMAASDDLMGG